MSKTTARWLLFKYVGEKSKALYQRKEEWLKGCTERLNEARANLRAAEDLDVWSLLGTGEGLTSRATSGSTQDDE